MNQDQARQKCLKIPEVVGRMILMLDPESLLIVPRTVADMEFVNKKKVHSQIFRLKILHHQFHLTSTVLVRKNTKNEWKWRNLHRWQKFYTAHEWTGFWRMHPVVVLPWMDKKRILILERKISNCSCAIQNIWEKIILLTSCLGGTALQPSPP